MASFTYFLLFAVISHVAYSIICSQRLRGSDMGTEEDCGDSCAFCHSITRSGGADDENFEVFGCGCGENSIAKSLKPDDFQDCDGEYESLSVGPEHAYKDEEKCCTSAVCH
ncbi:unnamed protein product, partial [Mesorhabditis belari]|uniref:Uncharacterized protein n=1 Tax=Mesorhabditis belari TaxID=2138241 RepID=A0AAF3EKQ9_9BILA